MNYSKSVNSVVVFLSFTFCIFLAWGQEAKVVPGEYIIKYKMDLAQSNAIGKIQSKVVLKAAFPEMNMLHMSVKPGQENAVHEIKNDPDVLFIEPNYILEKLDDGIAGQIVDTLSAEEVYAQASTSFSQNYSSVRVEQAWQIMSAYTDSNRPVVAILDTGLDSQHNVVKNSRALWVNLKEIPGNGVDDDQNGYVDDVNGWNFISNNSNYSDDEGHGTHVAGIVIGAGLDIFSQQIDLSRIQVMPLKFLDNQGSGSTANAIKAIYYAVNNGARVINNSWGGPGYSSALLEAMTYAYNRHVLLVSAAGNSSKNNDTSEMYPANYGVPSNISIAATSDTDRLASFSNYGAQTVHLASPGVYIYSTLPGNSFGSMSGTSMAAPFVSGMAALALREAPQMSGYQLKTLLISTANPIGTLTNKIKSGSRIDTYSFISQIKSNPSSAASQPDYKPVYAAERSLASEAAPAPSSKSRGGCGSVSALSGAGGGAGSGGGGGPMGVGESILLVMLLAPFMIYTYLRAKAQQPVYMRQHERFMMDSDIKVKFGDRELVGHMKTISLGGLSFNADEMLEKGGSVMIKIKGPDGKELDVEGRVVWSESNQSYGVKFEEQRNTLQEVITGWTSKLVKSS